MEAPEPGITLTVAPTVVTSDPAKVSQALLRGAGTVSAAVAMRVMQRLIELTPRLTGHAASNWIAAVGFEYGGIAGSKEEVDTTLQQASMDRLRFYGIEQGLIFISNNVPYIRKLNAGYSKQRSAGWVERTTMVLEADLGLVDIKL